MSELASPSRDRRASLSRRQWVLIAVGALALSLINAALAAAFTLADILPAATAFALAVLPAVLAALTAVRGLSMYSASPKFEADDESLWSEHLFQLLALAAITLSFLGTLGSSGLVVVDAVSGGGGLAGELGLDEESGVQDGDDSDDGDDERLAEQFAPVLRLSRREAFVPLSRAAYLSVAGLRRAVPSRVELLPFVRMEDRLAGRKGCGRAASCQYFLDIEALSPKQGGGPYAVLQGHLNAAEPPQVYWNTRLYPDGSIVIQYWFLYLFNDFSNRHESDWEHVAFLVRPTRDKDGTVVGYDGDTAYYSAHEEGLKRPWRAVRKISTAFLRLPVVFVGRGSHANYFVTGKFSVHLSPLKDRADGCGQILFPGGSKRSAAGIVGSCRQALPVRRYRLTRLRKPVFLGDWGKGNYVWRAQVQKKGFSDPQRRPAWRDPLAELSAARVDPAYLKELRGTS